MGVTAAIPDEWSPTQLSGDRSRGHFRVVGPRGHQFDVRWEQTPTSLTVERALDRYLAELGKLARRRKLSLMVKRRVRALEGSRRDPSLQTYTWQADQTAVGAAWRCDVCGRLVIAEVVGDPSTLELPARALIAGVTDHPEGGWTVWALYGLVAPAPDSFRLERQSLMTGHQQFTLSNGAEKILVDRWGLADLVLRSTTLPDWFRDREGTRFAPFRARVTPAEHYGHTAFRWDGELPIAGRLSRGVKALTRLQQPMTRISGLLWHCPNSNRIYAVFGEHRGNACNVFDVADRMRCHPQGAAA